MNSNSVRISFSSLHSIVRLLSKSLRDCWRWFCYVSASFTSLIFLLICSFFLGVPPLSFPLRFLSLHVSARLELISDYRFLVCMLVTSLSTFCVYVCVSLTHSSSGFSFYHANEATVSSCLLESSFRQQNYMERGVRKVLSWHLHIILFGMTLFAILMLIDILVGDSPTLGISLFYSYPSDLESDDLR